MQFPIGRLVVSCALALATVSTALAQAEETPVAFEDTTITETVSGSATTTLFLLVEPSEDDIEVPLATETLTIRGVTAPNTVVSIDGELIDTDDLGEFVSTVALEEGLNVVDVIASDVGGNQMSTTLFVQRGE
jgi:hypothetical protein